MPAAPATAGTARSGVRITYTAAPGERNDVSFRIESSGVRVKDRAGVTAGSGCNQVDATTALCDEVPSVTVRLRDGNDRMRVAPSLKVSASGGDGNDRLVAGRRQDRLRGGRGRDRLKPGRGLDVAIGGPGGDTIRSRDRSVDRIACGGGRDRVIVDRLDWPSLGCETVSRRSAAAVPLEAHPELVGGDFSPQFLRFRAGCPADGPATCAGAASIVSRGRRLARTAFSIPRGRQRSLAFDQSRLSEDLPVRFVLRSRDQHGRLATRAVRGTIEPFRTEPGEGPGSPDGGGGGPG
jgi:RTX calcium-binding nonapeptide repeat (4 copies)